MADKAKKKHNQQDVIVVGAGISGIYTAYLLKNAGFTVKVLEASDRWGGRIRTLDGFASLPVELGAEYIYGIYSLAYQYLDYQQVPMVYQKGKTMVWHKNILLSEKEAQKIEPIKQAFQFMENQWKYAGPEMTVKEYLAKQPFYPETKEILKGFATLYGTNNSRLGMAALAAGESKWKAGNKEFKVKTGLHHAFTELLDCVSPDIVFQSPVVEIDYQTPNAVTVQTQQGQKWEAKTVVLTVPISILKQNGIRFLPDLPTKKNNAIQRLGMDSVVKIVMKFKERFWKKKLYELYGGQQASMYYQPWTRLEGHTPILVAYLTGKKAERFGEMGNSSVASFVQELDFFFGNQSATNNLTDYYVMDWGKEPFIAGGYSYDPPHSDGARILLAQPIGNQVFFAGEATQSNGHHATVHGAMESAERVFAELVQVLREESS